MSVFNKLEKFNGDGDLKSWLQKFHRCCVISNKVEEAIKGQLILLCLEGKALVVGEVVVSEEGVVDDCVDEGPFVLVCPEQDRNRLVLSAGGQSWLLWIETVGWHIRLRLIRG